MFSPIRAVGVFEAVPEAAWVVVSCGTLNQIDWTTRVRINVLLELTNLHNEFV